MSKAEDLAKKAYPKKAYPKGDIYIFGDASFACRVAYVKGYHRAEKDLELSWEDIRELHIIFEQIDVDIELCNTDIKTETLGYYQEVLKQYKRVKYGSKRL